MSLLRRTAALAIVARSTLKPFERPDRLPRAVLAAAPWGTNLAALAAAAAARYPDAVAIHDEDGALTFADLWRRAHGVADGLVRAGAGPGAVIGLLHRNHAGFVMALLGAAMTGADVVLLNTGFAAPQLADVAAAERIGLLLHDDDLADVAHGSGVTNRLGETAIAAIAVSGRRVAPVSRGGRVVILTSGTTGRPKGATRPTSLAALEGVAGVLDRIPLRARDTQVVAAPLFHAWGLSHLLLGMSRSATTVVRRRFDATVTLGLVADHAARVLVVVPVMVQRIVDLPASVLDAADTTALAVIASSGSAIGPSVVSRVLDRFGPVLYNTYGSTEVAVATIATPSDLGRFPSTAGRPVLGVQVELLGEDDRPVPTGARGRVYVGSTARFAGYTDGTAKRTVRGLLSSGDVGRFDADGRLFIEGRDDEMIVSGGENVYPQEVEEVLGALAGVAEVAVTGVPDEAFGQALVAHVVRRTGPQGDALDADAVRAHVRSQLARHKVPRRVEFVDALPRTTTGKVRRRDLGEPPGPA